VLTAAELNTAGAWTSFTPTWTNLVVGNGVVSAQYSVLNKILFVRVKLTAGTTTTFGAGSPFIMTLPASLSQDANQYFTGWAYFLDSGTAGYMGAVGVSDATTVLFYVINASGTYATATSVANTRPQTWANTDQLIFEFTTRLT
jgi:hypothetical protein